VLTTSLLLLRSSPTLLHQHALLKLQVLHQATPTTNAKETLATTVVAAAVDGLNLLLLATAVLLAMAVLVLNSEFPTMAPGLKPHTRPLLTHGRVRCSFGPMLNCLPAF